MALGEPSVDLALQPSPVLLEAVLKVEQVVSRLQNLQSTISGIQLSPVNPKHMRASRANATTRARSSKECSSSRDITSYSSQSRDEYRRKSLKYNNTDSEPVQGDLSLKSKEWKRWSSPANQVHDVISEILVASEFAKQIATLVAEALQDGPQKKQEPAADQVQEPKKKTPKDGKRRDIAFPSKAQVQKTMSAKAPPSKPVNKFKVAFSESAAKSAPPVKLPRSKDPPTKSGSRRKVSRASWSNSSSPDSLSSHRFSSPSGSFREDDADADDELASPRRLSMNVTEIKGSVKPWKLTPTKGVLFSNPVYLETSPPKAASPAKPSPTRIVPTTGRRRSWLTLQFPKSQKRCSPEADKKLRGSVNSKATFKREGPTKKVALPSRYVEVVPLDGPRDNSLVSTLDVLKVRSPSRLPVSRRDANNGRSAAVADRRQEIVEQCRAPHSHAKSTPLVECIVVSKQAASDKENAPLPSCAPNAAKFLRNMSSGQTLNRTTSRKNSAVSLLQRAKGWMSSQVVRQGKVRELDRWLPPCGSSSNLRSSVIIMSRRIMDELSFTEPLVNVICFMRELTSCSDQSPEARGFTSTRRYSLPGQLRAITSTTSRRLSLPGHLQATWKQHQVTNSETKYGMQPSKPHADVTFQGQRKPKPVHVFKVRYPLKPVLGSSLFPGTVETFMPGPKYGSPPTLNLRRQSAEKHRWLRRATKLVVSVPRVWNHSGVIVVV